jgi:hypothetical protein
MPAYRNPDDNLVVVFKHQEFQNEGKSLAEGRPIFDDLEVCVVHAPGSRDVRVYPATMFSRWEDDMFTGRQRQVSYAERFAQQYRQFKANAAQTKSGTPLDHAPFLTAARRAELRAQNVYTVEMLADIEGAELKNLGQGGREMKNQAMEFIAESKVGAPNVQMAAEMEALKARNAILEEDLAAKKNGDEGEFADMTRSQLRDYIATNTGQEPIGGQLDRKTLIRLAKDARPERVA